MKYLLLLFVSISLISCSSDTPRLDLNLFNGSHQKAFYSQFSIINDKIYQLDSKEAYTGKIASYKGDTLIRESTVKEGDFENIKIYINGEVALEINKKGQTLSSQSYPLKGNYIVSETKCNCTKVANAALINVDLGKLEGTCETKLPAEKISISSQTTKTGDLISNEAIARYTDTQAVIYKELTLLKEVSESDYTRVVFKESFAESVLNKDKKPYTENIRIIKNEEAAELSLTYDKEKNIEIAAKVDSPNLKHCNAVETLHQEGLYHAGDESEDYEKEACVTDGLRLLNEALKKNISRKDLKNRIETKRDNHVFLTKTASDTGFYF